MHSRGSSPGSEHSLPIRRSSDLTASASLRGSSCRRLLLSRTSWTDCSPASERSLRLPPYPMHSPGSSPGSEQHLKISPRQSSTGSAKQRSDPYPSHFLVRTLLLECSLASELSSRHPPYRMH